MFERIQMCMCMRVYTNICYVCMSTCALYIFICACMCVRIFCAYACACVYICIDVYLHVYVCTYLYAIHIYTHKYTLTYTHKHTPAHRLPSCVCSGAEMAEMKSRRDNSIVCTRVSARTVAPATRTSMSLRPQHMPILEGKIQKTNASKKIYTCEKRPM